MTAGRYVSRNVWCWRAQCRFNKCSASSVGSPAMVESLARRYSRWRCKAALAISPFLIFSNVVEWWTEGLCVSDVAGLCSADEGPKMLVRPVSSTEINCEMSNSSSDGISGGEGPWLGRWSTVSPTDTSSFESNRLIFPSPSTAEIKSLSLS